MSAADWVALVPTLGAALGVGIRLISRLTRLADSVDRLVTTVTHPDTGLAAKVADCEARLTRAGL